jgi:hypothetical protein
LIWEERNSVCYEHARACRERARASRAPKKSTSPPQLFFFKNYRDTGNPASHFDRHMMVAQHLLVCVVAVATMASRGVQAAHAAPPAVCNSSASSEAGITATCKDFCSSDCSFRNASSPAPADQGLPLNLTLYRITPQHVLGIANRNTGDPPGDVGFFLSRKTLAAECARDPTNIRCFLDGINIYGKFEVEMDGAFGPYHMCNPTHGEDDTVDSNWKCYQYCETPPKCDAWAKQRDAQDWQGTLCYCPNGRGNQTVGRVHRESYHGHGGHPPPPPVWWPTEQCAAVGLQPSGGYCINGTVSKTLPGATPAECCAACSTSQCVGWGMQNGLDGEGKGDCQLMTEPMRYHRAGPGSKCIAAYKEHHGGGGGYISGGVLGGYWYSTPALGECKGAARPGDGSGCTWRLVAAEKYANATCVNGKVDAAVEAYNRACFAKCPGGAANSTSGCYLTCYDQAINGGGSPAVKKMPTEQVTGPWVTALAVDDPAEGGCAALHPRALRAASTVQGI